jgi:hypothetical protein
MVAGGAHGSELMNMALDNPIYCNPGEINENPLYQPPCVNPGDQGNHVISDFGGSIV